MRYGIRNRGTERRSAKLGLFVRDKLGAIDYRVKIDVSFGYRVLFFRQKSSKNWRSNLRRGTQKICFCVSKGNAKAFPGSGGNIPSRFSRQRLERVWAEPRNTHNERNIELAVLV